MPFMDAGEADGLPGPSLTTVWATLSPAEAVELLQTLQDWAERVQDGLDVTGWHHHITDSEGRELTIAVGEPTSEST